MTEKAKRALQQDDLFKFKTLQNASLSPDGNLIIYGVSYVDEKEEKEYEALWMHNRSTGETRQLTSGKFRDSNPVFSPDGKTIAFQSNRLGIPQIFLMKVDGGEPFALTEMKQGVGGGPKWSPDGKSIAFTSGPAVEPPDYSKPYRVTRSVYRFDGVGMINPIVQDIYTIDVESKETSQLTDDKFHNSIQAWAPDGKEILYTATMNPEGFAFFATLKSVNLEGECKAILADEWHIESAIYTPDGKSILFVGNNINGKLASNNNLYLIPRNGGEPEIRSSKIDHSFCGALRADFPKNWRAMNAPLMIFSKDAKFIYTTLHIAGSIHIYKVAVSGAESMTPMIADPNRPAVLMDTNDEILLYAVSTHQIPSDLFLSGMQGKNEEQLTDINAEILAEVELGNAERITYPNENGQEIEGWVMKPAQGEGPFPTLLYIHGGPHSAFGNMFSFDYHMLAGAGYAVLFTNPRGSSGYGSDFANSILEDWGDPVFDDLMRAVDHIIEKGIADPDKLGCYGLSYGGYMSCWIVGQTDRFKASIPENPVSNLTSFYGTSDIGHLFLQKEMGGLPHEVPETYTKLSPVTYAHKSTTPTLMIQGEADFRCPAEQSEQFYTILRANGCITDMIRLPNSPHSGTISGPLAVRKYANEAMLDWLDRYVKGVTKEDNK